MKHKRAPTLAEIEAIALDTLERLPKLFRRNFEGVIVRVEEFPDEETEREMELESPFDLMGLFRGVAIGHETGDLPREPAMVFLYRRPLLDYWCETGEDLRRLVAHVVVHEFGHFLGMSDADMEAIEAAVDERA